MLRELELMSFQKSVLLNLQLQNFKNLFPFAVSCLVPIESSVVYVYLFSEINGRNSSHMLQPLKHCFLLLQLLLSSFIKFSTLEKTR